MNGPGEATHADMGIAFGKGGGLLYKDGEKIGHVDEDQAIERLLDMIENEENETAAVKKEPVEVEE